jgi:hypothetical protein
MADDIGGLPQDLLAGMQDLQTRRAMALALLQQNLQDQGTQMAGQVAIRQSPFALLGRGLNIMGARDDIAGLPAQQQALLDAHQQRLADATTALIGAGQTSQGTPTVITEGAGPPTESGDTSLMVKQGTPAGFGDPAMLGKALAQYGAVGGNPQLSSSILQRRMALELAQSMNPGAPQPAQYGSVPVQQPDFPGAPVAGPAQMTIPPTPMMGGGGGGQGGGIYGVNMPAQLQAALMAGLPGAKEAMELYGKMNAPMEMKPGSFVYDPTIKGMRAASPGEYGQPVIQNGAVVRYDAIPGQAANKAAAAGAVAGAEATATLPTKLVTVSLGGGKTIELPGDMALDLARRGLGQIAPVGAPAGAPAPVPGPAPAAIAAPNPATATTAAPGMAGPQGTTDTKPYYGSFPAVPQAPVTIGVSPSTAEKTFTEATAKDWGEQSNLVSVKGRDAANTIQRAKEIQQLSTMFTPGKATPMLADTAAWLQSVGVPQSIVDGVSKGNLAAYQTMGHQRGAAESARWTTGSDAQRGEFAKSVDDEGGHRCVDAIRGGQRALADGENAGA